MSISTNIQLIKSSIPNEVKLIAVSKTKGIEEIREAYNEGIRDFGENKVQELMSKIDVLPKDIRWHLIGHLQTNKIKYIVGKVHLIHSLDSISLLNEIEKRYSEKGYIANTLIQINIGREESKTGIYEESIFELINEVEKCSFVKVKGLMAIIPKGGDESCRYYFKKLKNIFDNLKSKNFNNIEMQHLSMGMSNDYNLAIEEGSNMVRIGQGIFGKREYNK